MERDLLRATARSLGGRLFIALWGGLALTDVAGRAVGGLVAVVLVVALVVACDVHQPPLAAATVAAVGWLVINGFVLHPSGELGFGSASWWTLVAVVAVGVGVALGTGPEASAR